MTTTKKDSEEELENEEIIQIRIDISGPTKVMFKAFQKKYNIERYTDTFRLIVKRAYDLDIAPHITE